MIRTNRAAWRRSVLESLQTTLAAKARQTMESLSPRSAMSSLSSLTKFLDPVAAAELHSPFSHCTSCLRMRIGTLSDAARHFNRSISTLCETLEHYRKLKPELFAPHPTIDSRNRNTESRHREVRSRLTRQFSENHMGVLEDLRCVPTRDRKRSGRTKRSPPGQSLARRHRT